MTTSQRDMLAVARSICIGENATLLEAIATIEKGAQAIAFVCDKDARVIGTVTDGDIRRALLKGNPLDARCLPQVMRKDFVSVAPETSLVEVLDLMRVRKIDQIPVLDEQRKLAGMHSVRQLIVPDRRENRAVILAGGKGVRLRPLTETLPKPMIPVAGRPILERLVLHLVGHGITELYLSVNYLAHMIEDHFGDGSRFGCRITYLRETTPLGTGGPLSLIPKPEAPVIVLNGDLVTQFDIGAMLDFHNAGGYIATFGIRPHRIDIPYGVAKVCDDQLVELQEKPTERILINAGIYVLSPEAVARVPADVEYPITDLFTRLLDDKQKVGAHVIQDDWIDVGQHQELRRARGEQ